MHEEILTVAALTQQILLYRNSQLIELIGLVNSKTGLPVTTAIVSVTLKDKNGVNVPGETWPLNMPHVADGTYDAVFSSTLGVILKEVYTAEVSADGGGGLIGFWKLPLVVRERKFS